MRPKRIVLCRDVYKTYGEKETRVEALRGVNLEVFAGELVMIAGPSGCGKTTLLSIISGILPFDQGVCEVFGHNLSTLSESAKTAFRKKHIGFIFQALNLIPTLTALENVEIPLLLNGNTPEEIEKQSRAILKSVGLEKRIEALPSHMSGGEQQRVAICRGCIHNPGLIVCDEPTSTLDHETGIKVMQLFRKIAVEEGKALIVVTHDARILDFADRILKMDDGRLL